MRQVEQLKDDRLILAEHFAGGDAEKQAVTNLAGGAGDRDAHGGFGHDAAPVERNLQWVDEKAIGLAPQVASGRVGQQIA